MSLQNDRVVRQKPVLLHLTAGKAEAGLVGGKAARLTELHELGFPVPPGIVLTVEAFRQFCLWNRIDVNEAAAEPESSARRILQGELPREVSEALQEALARYPFRRYAVRSSSIAEDGMEHSMAGQFETFLDIASAEVGDRIKACWASMFSSAVAAYTEKSKLTGELHMGVIVQEQKHPELAGVVFTMNPLTKDTDHLIVEWVEGLGDRLVAGEVTPHRLHVSRMTQRVPAVPGGQEAAQALARLIQLSLRIEQSYQYPVDIEWCAVRGEVVILQVRPVTGVKSETMTLWTNVNMVENFPSAVTPLTWSLVDRFYQYYTKSMLQLFGWKERRLESLRAIVEHTTGIHAGRIYYNLTNWYEGAYLLPVGPLLKKLLDQFIGQYVPFQFEPRLARTAATRNGPAAFRYADFLYHFGKLWASADRKVGQYEAHFYERRKRWRAQAYSRQSLEQLLGSLDDLMNGFAARYYDRPAIVDLLAAVFPGGLKLLIKKWTDGADIHADLAAVHVLQTDDLRSLEPTRLIEEQARLLKNQPELRLLVEEGRYGDLEARLPAENALLFARFMDQFGGRCYHDCTLVSPTFEERSDLYWELVSKYQAAGESAAAEAASAAELSPAAVAADWQRRISALLPGWKRLLFRWLLRQAHRAIRLRERSRLIRSLLFGEIRQIALQVGLRLQEKGHLQRQDDVFYLRWNEIEELAFGKFQFPETLGQLIVLRREAHSHNELADPPAFFIREQGVYYKVEESARERGAVHEGRLVGVPVSGGQARGRARIVLDPVRDKGLEPGDILVTRSTDPGWTPLFKIAGGLVLEKGGMLSHGAIVAREFGIPAITAVEGAMTAIQDGDLLLINGDTGEIEWLERAAEESDG